MCSPTQTLYLTFQFHKGTIKTRMQPQHTIRRGRFQFHKGTIKTQENGETILPFDYFNSIKVRLKPVKSKAYKPRRLYRFAGAKIQKNLQKNVDA